jgi:hypothetical protein
LSLNWDEFHWQPCEEYLRIPILFNAKARRDRGFSLCSQLCDLGVKKSYWDVKAKNRLALGDERVSALRSAFGGVPEWPKGTVC